jgi:hypothetical protein
MDDKTKAYWQKRSVIVKKFHAKIEPALGMLSRMTESNRVEKYLSLTRIAYSLYRQEIESLGPPGYFGGEE